MSITAAVQLNKDSVVIEGSFGSLEIVKEGEQDEVTLEITLEEYSETITVSSSMLLGALAVLEGFSEREAFKQKARDIIEQLRTSDSSYNTG